MQIPNTFNLKVQAEKYIPIHSEKELISALQEYHNPFVLGVEAICFSLKILRNLCFTFCLKALAL